MLLLGFTTAALMLFMVAIGLDLGGSIGAMLFLLVLFIGATVKAYRPLIEWLRGPAAKL